MAGSVIPSGGHVLTLSNRRLVPCKDCGHQISVDATSCPKCGSAEPRVRAITLPECILCKSQIRVDAGSANGAEGAEPVPVSHGQDSGLKTKGGWWLHDQCAQKLMAL